MIAPLVALLTALPGLALVAISVLFVFGLVRTILTNQALMFQAVIAGLMLTFVWYLYMHLPNVLQRFISRLLTRSKRDDQHGH